MPGSTGEPRGHGRLRLVPPSARGRGTGRKARQDAQGASVSPPLPDPAHGSPGAPPAPIPLHKSPAASAATAGAAPASHSLNRLLNVLFCAGTLLLARAALIQGLAPFHLALAAAVLYLLPRHWAWAFTGAFLGRLLWAGPAAAFFDLMVLGGLYTTARSFQDGLIPLIEGMMMGARHWRPAGGAALATLVGTGVQVLATDPTPYGLVLILFRTTLVALLTVVFTRALLPLRRLLEHDFRSLGDLLVGLASWSDEGSPWDVEQDEWLAAAVGAGALIAAIHGLQVGSLSLSAMVAGCIILAFAAWGGPGRGAAAGAAAGLLVMLQSPGAGLPAAAYAVSGLLAGLFRDFGLVGIAGGYAIGILLLAGFSLDPRVMVVELWSLLPATLAYALLRYAVTRSTDGLLPGFLAPEAVSGGWRAATAEAAAAADGAAVAGLGLAPEPASDGGIVIDLPLQEEGQAGESRPSGPAGGGPTQPVLNQLAHLMRDMASAIHSGSLMSAAGAGAVDGTAAPILGGVPHRKVEEWLNDLAGQVCPGCIHHATCWDKEFFQTYQGLSDLIVRREVTGSLREDHLPAGLRARCPRREQLVAAVDQAYRELQNQRHWQQKLQQSRRLMAQQLESLAEVARYLADHPPAHVQAAGARRGGKGAGAMPYRVGAARVARDERLVSGDSYLTRLLPGGRLALILSDGMGAGMVAAGESRTAVELLERLLGLDLDPALAIKLINRLIMARTTEDSYTTLDLTLIDLAVPAARFVKVGAPPSFIRHEDRVAVVRAGTPPIGILDDVALEISTRRMRRGDMVVMVTDGVLGAWQDVRAGEAWLKGFLGSLPRDQPRWVATQVVRQALRHAGGEARDDMTALVVKIL